MTASRSQWQADRQPNSGLGVPGKGVAANCGFGLQQDLVAVLRQQPVTASGIRRTAGSPQMGMDAGAYLELA